MWGFKFNQVVDGKLHLTKDNVINKKVALTITNTVCNKTSSSLDCSIEVKNIPEIMTSFSVDSVPTISLNALPNYSAVNGFTLEGNLNFQPFTIKNQIIELLTDPFQL